MVLFIQAPALVLIELALVLTELALASAIKVLALIQTVLSLVLTVQALEKFGCKYIKQIAQQRKNIAQTCLWETRSDELKNFRISDSRPPLRFF